MGADASDYRYFLINWLIKTVLIVPFWSLANRCPWDGALAKYGSRPLFLPWRYRTIVLTYTLALFVAR